MAERGSYRPIHTVLIDESGYQQLSPPAKLVFLTLKIQLGPSGIGVVRAATHTLADQTGYSAEEVEQVLEELVAVERIRIERNVVEIVGGLDNEPSIAVSNSNHRKAIVRHLDGLPNLLIVTRFKELHPNWFSPITSVGQEAILEPPGMALNTHRRWDPNPITITRNEKGDRTNEKRLTETGSTSEALSSPSRNANRTVTYAARADRKAHRSPPFEALRGEALIIVGNLRSKRQFIPAPAGGGYRIPKAEVEALSPAARRAVAAVGGADCIASVDDQRLPIVFGQFATAYASARTAEAMVCR